MLREKLFPCQGPTPPRFLLTSRAGLETSAGSAICLLLDGREQLFLLLDAERRLHVRQRVHHFLFKALHEYVRTLLQFHLV